MDLAEWEDITEDMDYEKYSKNLNQGKKSHLYTFLFRNDVIPIDVKEVRHKLEYNVSKDGGEILIQLLDE